MTGSGTVVATEAFEEEFSDWLTSGTIATIGYFLGFFLLLFVVYMVTGRSSS